MVNGWKEKLLNLVAECAQEGSMKELVELFNESVTLIADGAAKVDDGACCTGNNSCNHQPNQQLDKDSKIEHILDSIHKYLGDNFLAIAPNEDIAIPEWSPNYHDFTDANTVHVDAFLYDEEDVDGLVDQGKLHRNRCNKCYSLDVSPMSMFKTRISHVNTLDFVSHSASLHQLRWIMEVALDQTLKQPNSCLIDVGSRLGSVLYAAYLYTSANHIVGIELDEYFYNLQHCVVQEQHLADKIQLFHKDITSSTGIALLTGALPSLPAPNVVVFNNVFQFFCGKESSETDAKGKASGKLQGRELLQSIWSSMRNALAQPGIVLVCLPSLEEQFEEAGIKLDIGKWVENVDVSTSQTSAFQELYHLDEDQMSDIAQIFLYRTI